MLADQTMLHDRIDEAVNFTERHATQSDVVQTLRPWRGHGSGRRSDGALIVIYPNVSLGACTTKLSSRASQTKRSRPRWHL